ncbi:FAD-dependent oxidoreductase [Kitasatospora sp. NPDC056651]|uniref:FAD-dependent oxidoreductase n=1 Tax=Kitasatospora sp. NPDC056651 TaxID=3345892 RepID=UPI003675F840
MTATAVIVGGSLSGLATALALAERGRPVRILERSAPPPEGPAGKAAGLWHRPTVPQGDHSHILTSLGVRVLRERAPRLLDTALEEGARLLDLTAAEPTTARRRQDGDEQLVALAARRPFLELLLHRAVRSLPGVTISHGTSVRGLLLDAGRARVTGVVTDRGEHVPAAFVVDATGRRARSRDWLADAGVTVAEGLSSPTRLRAFTRYYRLNAADGALPGPLNRGNAAGGIWDHYAAVVHPADNGVFAISIGAPTSDPPTDALREPAALTAAARLSPHVGAWADERVATPLTPVRAMTTPPNLLRSTATVDGRPVLGLFPIGDAVCVTDPLYGRGMSLALAHAFRTADLLDDGPATEADRSEAAARLADTLLRPWFDQAVHDSLARGRLWQARAEGSTPTPPVPAVPGRPAMGEVAAAAATDATVWRGLVRMLMTLSTPAEVLDDDAFRARVRAAATAATTAATTTAATTAPTDPRPPTRGELLRALAGGGGA